MEPSAERGNVLGLRCRLRSTTVHEAPEPGNNEQRKLGGFLYLPQNLPELRKVFSNVFVSAPS